MKPSIFITVLFFLTTVGYNQQLPTRWQNFPEALDSLISLEKPEPIHSLFSPRPVPKYSPQFISIDSVTTLLTWVDPREGRYQLMGGWLTPQNTPPTDMFPLSVPTSSTLFSYGIAAQSLEQVLVVSSRGSIIGFQWINLRTKTSTPWETFSRGHGQPVKTAVLAQGIGAVLVKYFSLNNPYIVFVDSNRINRIITIPYADINNQSLCSDFSQRFFLTYYDYTLQQVVLNIYKASGQQIKQVMVSPKDAKINEPRMVWLNDSTIAITWRQISPDFQYYFAGVFYNYRTQRLSSLFTIDYPVGYHTYRIAKLNETTLLVVSKLDSTFRFSLIQTNGTISYQNEWTVTGQPLISQSYSFEIPERVSLRCPIVVLSPQKNAFHFVRADLINQSFQIFDSSIPDSQGAFQVDPMVIKGSSHNILYVWKDYRNGRLEFRFSLMDPAGKVLFKDQPLWTPETDFQLETAAGYTNGDFALLFSHLDKQYNRKKRQWLVLSATTGKTRFPYSFYLSESSQIRIFPYQNNYIILIQWHANQVKIQLSRRYPTALVETIFTPQDPREKIVYCAANSQGKVGIITFDGSTLRYKIMPYNQSTLLKQYELPLKSTGVLLAFHDGQMDSLSNFYGLFELKYIFPTKPSTTQQRTTHYLNAIRIYKDGALLAPFTSLDIPRLQLLRPSMIFLAANVGNTIYLHLFNDKLRTWQRVPLADFSQYLSHQYRAEGFAMDRTLTIIYNSPEIPHSGMDILQQQFLLPEAMGITPQQALPITTTEQLFTPFPNPATEIVHVVFQLFALTHVQLDIINIHGQKIRTVYQGVLPEGNHLISFNVAHLPSGVYFLRMKAMDTVVRKFVVIK